MVRKMKFRFKRKGKYYYFSLPYMSNGMFKLLQSPDSDNIHIEQCFIETAYIYGASVDKEVWL